MKETYKLIARNSSGKTQGLFAQLIQHDGGQVVGWDWEPPPRSCNSVGATPATFTSSAHVFTKNKHSMWFCIKRFLSVQQSLGNIRTIPDLLLVVTVSNWSCVVFFSLLSGCRYVVKCIPILRLSCCNNVIWRYPDTVVLKWPSSTVSLIGLPPLSKRQVLISARLFWHSSLSFWTRLCSQET